jgi:hypothetical protein
LFAGTLSFWLLVAYPARLLWGDAAAVFSGVAALLCLVPMAVTLVWSYRAFHGSPEKQLAAVLGGTVLRMLFVICAGLALCQLHPYFNGRAFWIWVVVFYLFTLTLEMVLLLGRASAKDGPENV